MENKIFLGKYRVAPSEIEVVGELRDTPLAYEGKEIDSGRKVIVELVPVASFKPAVRAQLEEEAAAAKKLSHINIPALYDFGVEDDHLVYVTEDFDGTLAEEWVNAHGPMPVGAVLRIAAQVVSALGSAALQRISHHAINPTNLVLVPGQTPEGEWPLVKVLHFVGVAPKFSGADEAVAAFDKSAHYASPEQLQHGSVDFRSEVYSLGCTMWFLLTGAPPLSAAKGPIAVPGTPSLDKLMSSVPKAIRRLLAQMLSKNPNDRPGDPLAFFRQIQDCLDRVERRETMARRFGVATISTTSGVETLRRRRRPMKTLALAAVLLALAALTAAILQGYLRHRRVVRSEEPIGVPIGVADASAPTPPTAVNTVVPSEPPPNTTIANLSNTQPTEANRPEVENHPPPAATTSPAEVASTNQVAPAPVEPTPPADSQAEPTAPVVTNNVTSSPSETESAAIASTTQVEPGPTQAKSPEAKTKVVEEETESGKTVLHEVRRAEPAEPEVRRAEPAPPEEGPTPIASEPKTNSVAAPEESRNVTAELKVPSSRSVKRTETQPKATAKPRARKPERDAKPKNTADRRVYVAKTAPNFDEGIPPLPPGSVRARFVGVTADGRWMLALPSRKVILVPPPPPEPYDN